VSGASPWKHLLTQTADIVTAEQVFATFIAAVTAAQTEIKDFGTLYNSEESQKALDQARKSREAEPQEIKPWLHNDEPDWYFMDE